MRLRPFLFASMFTLFSAGASAQSVGVKLSVGGASQGVNVSNNAVVSEIQNGSSAVSIGQLVKLSGNPSTTVIPAVGDTDGVVGIVLSTTAAAGTTSIAIAGQAACIFENAVTAGDFVSIGTTTAGTCHDTGSSAVRPAGQTIGRVLTSGAAGTYLVALDLAGSRGGITGYEIKGNSCTGNNTTTCVATCSAGKQVLGGGCGVNAVSGGSFFLQNSNPSGMTSWACYYGGSYTSITLGAQAICASTQ